MPRVIKKRSLKIPGRDILAAKVRAVRALLGWSQTELGQRIGLTQRSVHKIENGAVDVRSSTIEAIDGALHRLGFRFETRPDGGFKISVPGRVVTRALGRR